MFKGGFGGPLRIGKKIGFEFGGGESERWEDGQDDIIQEQASRSRVMNYQVAEKKGQRNDEDEEWKIKGLWQSSVR